MDIDRHRGMTKDYRDGYRQTQRDDKSLQRWIQTHRGMTKAYRDGYRQIQRDDKSLQRWIQTDTEG